MIEAERRVALEQIADEVRACTRCRLHEQRTRAVPGEGNPDTEVVFVGEGPGFNEDREGRPFVGRAGALLVRLLASIGWRREDVFITNVVKCRPPDNRDPQPDEIAACSPYLRRQLEVLDPALVVTLGRYSMGTFMPGARISHAHGTMTPAPTETGAGNALAFAMYHPAAALRATELEWTSFADMAAIPVALLAARERRDARATAGPVVSEEPQSHPIFAPASGQPRDPTRGPGPVDDLSWIGPNGTVSDSVHAQIGEPADPANASTFEPASNGRLPHSPSDIPAGGQSPVPPATATPRIAAAPTVPAAPPPPGEIPTDQLTLF